MLDLRLPGISGLQALQELKAQGHQGPVIIMTAYGEVKTAVQAMKSGAYDYITKPFDVEELKHVVQGALRYAKLTTEVTRLRQEAEEIPPQEHCHRLTKMMVFSVIERVSASDVCVDSRRKQYGKKWPRPSIMRLPGKISLCAGNCAASRSTCSKAKLSATRRARFQGLEKAKPGKFEAAHGGTVFLDEVEALAHTA